MKYLLSTPLFLFLLFPSCKSQQNAKAFNLSELVFSSIFANSKKNSLHTYCLLGSGYFRSPTADNADSIINDWLARHPKALVIPVATHGPTMTDFPDSKMTYCWVIDKKDTLNNYLIRTGCFPGGTMERPKMWEEMTAKERGIWKDYFKVNVHVDKTTYDRFIDQIKAAELFAIEHHLGIWNKKDEFEE